MWSLGSSFLKCQFKSGMLRANSRVCLLSTKSESTVIVGKVGAVATIGINRPSKRNCVDVNTARLLRKSFEDFEKDDSVKVAVLHGIGGNFCAGFDLKELATEDVNSIFTASESDRPMGPSRMFVKKPVIGAISGFAVAGGFELALFCDLRVVEDTAVMGVFNRRFGVPLIDGGTVRLPALIGLSRALDLVLTGRAIRAKEAFEWGLANRIVACGTGLGQAINLATSLVKFPQQCLLADRKACYYNTFSATSIDDAFKYESSNVDNSILSEAVSGAKQFVGGIGRHGKFALSEPLKENS